MATTPTRGERNNNPGNIRSTKIVWKGEVPSADSSFESFATPEDGIRAIAKLLTNYHKAGHRTIRAMINTWAPPCENDTGAYVADVAKSIGIDADQDLLLVDQTLEKIVHSIIKHENGRVVYTDTQIAAGVAAAHA